MGGLVINEINSSPDDWVELMNTGTEAIDISGYEIRDNSDDHRYQLPEGTKAEAGGLILVDAKSTGKIYDKIWTAHASYDGDAAKASYGRYPDGTGSFVLMPETKGEANTQFVPQIVINEVESNGDVTDWVEIYNAGTTPVDISGWYIMDNDPVKHAAAVTPVAEGTILNPGEYYVFDQNVHFTFGLGNPDQATVYNKGGTRKTVYAVKDVSFQIEKGKILGLVGESGCGKSTVAKTILNLAPADGGRVSFRDNCLFDCEQNRKITQNEMEKLRKKMQIVFQDPASCLDPRKNIEQILSEGMKKHHVCEKGRMREHCIEIMEKCGLDRALLMRYPHELSGGQKQRVAIARVFALEPEFIVCDELTAALDVSVQSQILNLLLDLKEQSGLTYLFISHNLEVVKYFCDDVIIMYKGEIVEQGKCMEVYEHPLHPYTKLLMDSIPADTPKDRKIETAVIPKREQEGTGCTFYSRCPVAQARCRCQVPEMDEIEAGHMAACFFCQKIRV